jgi:uncharacterized protein (TIGR03643 family)
MAAEELICHYSDLPSPLSYMTVEKEVSKKKVVWSERDLNRIIEMAWEDRTPFDAIEAQFGLKEAGVKDLMKKNLTFSSYKLWRIRVGKSNTKHAKKRIEGVDRFKCRLQKSISLNKISKRT